MQGLPSQTQVLIVSYLTTDAKGRIAEQGTTPMWSSCHWAICGGPNV